MGTASVHAIGLKVGMTVGRYDLVRCIGQGGSGTVYEAVHRSLGRRVAVKLWHTRPADTVHAERAAKRFSREGRAAARVHHPHVVDVYDVGVEDGVPFLVMELVDGESLAQRLRRETRMPLETAIEILLPILSAVAELHAAGIVHRDIKPANILLVRGEMCPKLADFGVSRFDDGSPSITQSGAVIGTPAYMAPELVQGRAPASEQSDVYALGVSLYECVTGEKPFQGPTEYAVMHAVVSGAIPPPSARNPSLPEAFDPIALRAMHGNLHQRYGSVDELAEALLQFASPSVVDRWRSEFSAPGTPFGWDANASGGSSRRAKGGRPRPPIAGWIRAAVGAGAIAALVAGARTLRSRPEAHRPAAVQGAAATQAGGGSVPSMAPPTQPRPSVSTDDPLPAIVSPHAGPASPAKPRGPTIPPPSSSARSRVPTASSVTTPSSAGARPAVTSDEPPLRGENGSPILDVP